MKINLELVVNMLIALFLYNAVIKSIFYTILAQLLKTDKGKEERASFREKLKEKLNKES